MKKNDTNYSDELNYNNSRAYKFRIQHDGLYAEYMNQDKMSDENYML
ncbi:MAG: hypothetical protein KFW09_03155 [Oscillospiraceae bacterium]|nr:hypothetical protein [Oscillospiraceae bacterium]